MHGCCVQLLVQVQASDTQPSTLRSQPLLPGAPGNNKSSEDSSNDKSNLRLSCPHKGRDGQRLQRMQVYRSVGAGQR